MVLTYIGSGVLVDVGVIVCVCAEIGVVIARGAQLANTTKAVRHTINRLYTDPSLRRKSKKIFDNIFYYAPKSQFFYQYNFPPFFNSLLDGVRFGKFKMDKN